MAVHPFLVIRTHRPRNRRRSKVRCPCKRWQKGRTLIAQNRVWRSGLQRSFREKGDLSYNGQAQDFANDPKWDASRNRLTYKATDVGGAHNFGFSDTNHAGGKQGEVGGTFWRSGKYAYYADRIGPLSLDDRLAASGREVLQVGAPDTDMYLGWFNSTEKEKPPLEAGHFLGVHVGGPTRVGHYFHPAFTTAKGTRGMANG